MSTPTLPDVLRQLVLLAEIRGSADLIELRAAAAALDRLTPAERGALEGQLRRGDVLGLTLPAAIHQQLTAVIFGHTAATLENASAIPYFPRQLLERGALTTDQALVLVRDCGVATVTDWPLAAADGRLARLPDAAIGRIEATAPSLIAAHRPVPLSRALELLEVVIGMLNACGPLVLECSITGEARRFEPLVHTPSIAVSSPDPVRLLEWLCRAPGVDAVLHRTARRAIIVTQHTEVDVRAAATDEYGSVLFTTTGSVEHVRAVAARRTRAGLCPREEDVYIHAGLPWIPAEIRHGSGEIEAADAGTLPKLVTREDIRGDLHMHSTYSDGQDTIDAMVQAAVLLGYEYIAITDHSERASAGRTVSLDQLARQRQEIERLRERYPSIEILHGLEVDIMPDGRLDFPDAVLEPLDIVLASLHDAARHDGATLTRRCLDAIRHPLVNIISHPSNRLVGRRDPYPLDFAAVYQAAAETGTALEIDGGPSHLDLDGEHARAAIAAGVTVTVDSDCHRARSLLLQMVLGVGTARRGWVEPRHVLNCRPVESVRAFVSAKRRGAPPPPPA